MISVKEAKAIVQSAICPLPPVTIPLADGGHTVLADDIHARADIPGFDQSNVDGYAIRYADRNNLLTVTGESFAGKAEPTELQENGALRIFTGAPVPLGADTVVMQEKTIWQNGALIIQDNELSSGLHVRLRGTDIREGMLAIEKGTLLTPAATGYLASMGVDSVNVYPQPRVSLIVTGKELRPPGTPLAFGQVYESGSFILTTALRQAGIRELSISHCDDDLDRISQALAAGLDSSDMVLLTGGVSVGDYDFVTRAAERCGVSTIFHRVKQRPGKPLYFGMKSGKTVFGLPGNPSSILTCFYVYVIRAVERMTGRRTEEKIAAEMTGPYRKPAGLTHFLKGVYSGGKAEPLTAQESYRLSSFARSNCLIALPEEETVFDPGYMAEVYLL